VLSGLAKALGSDPSVKNINRIVRLPSTINTKTDRLAAVVEFNDVSYTLDQFPKNLIARKPRNEDGGDPIPLDLIEQMLAVTPYTGGPEGLDNRREQDGWLNHMMSVHEASGGDAADLFIAWSQNDTEYNGDSSSETIQARWDSLDSAAAGGVTRGSWLKLLRSLPAAEDVLSKLDAIAAQNDFADEPEDIEPPDEATAARFEQEKAERKTDFKYGDRVVIDVTNLGADLPKLSRKVQKFFIKAVAKPEAKAADQVFDRGGNLVHLSRNRLPPGTVAKFDSDYHVENELVTRSVGDEWFADVLERHFAFFRRGKKKGDGERSKVRDIAVGAPKPLVKRMVAIQQDWQYPKIKGTVETPTLRLDGTILDEPGFDKKSGLYFDPGLMKFPEIKKNPTKNDAKRALGVLLRLLADFPFADDDGVDGLSRSVAVALILTALCRRVLPIAPMFGIDAHEANTGKTELGQVAARIMTGRDTAARSLPHDEYQRKNELAAAFEAGDAMIMWDNVDGDKQMVEGGSLCAALTSEMIQCRRLGGNSAEDQIIAPTNSLIVATGNHLAFFGDMTKDRSLVCNLRTDLKLDQRTFEHWPLQKYQEQERPALVAAGLTILRAHRIAKDKNPQTSSNFRFDAWRSIVADALVWLGLPDPVLSTERSKADDPQEEAQREVMRTWARYLGEDEVTTSVVLGHATIRKAIADARATPENKLTNDSAVRYLKGMVGIKLVGYKLARWIDPSDEVTRWKVTCVNEVTRIPVDTQTEETSDTAASDFGED
jgi:Primase C terminal 2 (PriCT-2)